ncbi:uncharacterized protein IL334_005749 [Kwoniella shivajii]|uniref:Uncharacterized protein n=1 Tax=Kwoniella shivajii TaxID=564305 RepID=A0ABZ1D405_9TREE|nr:hypothetical protein IL334_005749 [Kwoniella shivajii]
MGFAESIPPPVKDNFNKIWTSPKKRSAALVVIICVILLITHTFVGSYNFILPSSVAANADSLRNGDWRSISDVDIVISHFNEDVNIMRESIKSVTSVLDRLSTKKSRRVIIYSKGETDDDTMKEMLDMSDEVVKIENVGREGETYLSHIVRNYENPVTNLAQHTIFMQPHVAWDWLFLPRLEKSFQPNTGFLSFGVYISHICGNDTHGQVHPRMADIYSMFRQDFCPPESVLGTWAGQFIVSRQRILENSLKSYVNLRDKFHEPSDHWIWKEGWWNNEPTNPTLGHALERSWPMIFGCTDPSLEKSCEEAVPGTSCQCLD